MNYNRNLMLVMFIIMSQLSWSQPYINMMGDCDTTDATLHYDNFAYFATDPVDTLKYTHVFSFYCNTSVYDLADVNLQKQFFSPFYFVSYDTVYYPLIGFKSHLIFSNRDSLNGKNEFVVELRLLGLNNAIAYIYGSDNATYNPEGFRTTLSYLVSLDNVDPFASNYTIQELTYRQIYNNSTSYLKEIRDSDRNNLLVGFEFLSPSTQTIHTKFILPNN